MSESTQLIIGFVTMVTISFLIGTFARRKDDSIKSFFYGDNNLTVSHVVNLLLSTSFSMNGMIYQTWLGYSIGWAAVLMQVIWCISYILLSKKANKVQSLISNNGTLHGSIASQFGAKAGKIAAIATVIGFTMLVGWELIVGTSLFSAAAPDNKALKYILIFALAGIGGIYTISGGLKGNLYANVFQNWFGVLSMIIVCIFIYYINKDYNYNSFGTLEDLFTNIGLVGFITNAFFSLSWQFVDMTNWQALGSQDSNESPKKALWYSAAWVLFVPGILGTILGLLLRSYPTLNPDNIFLQIVNVSSAYPILLIFISAGFVATMLSTIDGLMLASGQVITWDLTHHDRIIKLFLLKKEERNEEIKEEEKSIINLTRLWIFGLGIVGSIVFCFITISYNINIFDLVYIVTGAQMALVPVVISLLYGKNNSKKYGFESVFTGLITVIVLDFIGITMHDSNLNLFEPLSNYIKTGGDLLPYSSIAALLFSSIWSFGFNKNTILQ